MEHFAVCLQQLLGVCAQRDDDNDNDLNDGNAIANEK